MSGEGSEKDTGTTECSTDPAPASTTSTTAESESGKTCIEVKCKSPEIPGMRQLYYFSEFVYEHVDACYMA